MLPGVAPYYLDPHTSMECQTPQLSWDYVRFSQQRRIGSIMRIPYATGRRQLLASFANDACMLDQVDS